MNKLIKSLLAFALIVASAVLVAEAPVSAQGLPNAKVIIIDFGRVTAESQVGLDVNSQIQQQASKIKTWETNISASLSGEREELERQRTIVAPDAFEQMVLAFQQKGNGANNQLQLLQENLRNVSGQAQLEIQRVLRPIVSTLMSEKGANLSMDKQFFWQSDSAFDVTTEVISRLDAQLPTYKMSFMSVPEVK